MKTNWQSKKLGEVCDILDNLRKPITARDRKSGEFPYYGATGIQDYVDSYIFNEDLVLVGEDGARWKSGDNTAFQILGKTWVNNHAHVIRPHRDMLMDQWLIYFLNISDLSNYITGTTVKKLNQEKLRSIPIPLPTLETQKKIVAKLDEKFAKLRDAKRLREEALADTEKILSQTLLEIFEDGKKKGWEEKTLSDICLDTENIKWSDYGSQNFKYIDLSSVSRDYFSVTETQNINKKNAPSRAKKIIRNNDVIFGTTRPTLMRVTIIPKELDGQLCSTGFCLLRANSKKALPSFIFYFIRSDEFMYHMGKIQTGASYPAVSDSKVFETLIPLPSLSEQQKIVTKLDKLSEKIKTLRELQKSQLEDFKKLEKAYLKEAFNGELI